jgi:RNA polymerase sigma-70 factor (ECF subfamily)
VNEPLIRTLYSEHGAALESFALHQTNGDLGRARDAVREVLVRAWRHLEALDPQRDHTRGWLMLTLREVLIDGCSARSAHPETIMIDQPSETGVEGGMDSAQQGLLVGDAFNQLAPSHQDVIRECYFNGRSVAEAGERLGVQRGEVQSLVHHALRAPRATLIELGLTP